MNKRHTFIICTAINIVILFAGLFHIFSSHQDNICLYDIPLYFWNYYDSDNLFLSYYQEGRYNFDAETGPLESGIYNVRVFYEAIGEQFSLHYDCEMDGNVYPAIYAEEYKLDPDESSMVFPVWVNDSIDNLHIYVECGTADGISEDRSLYIDRIEVERNYRKTITYKFVKLLCLLCSVNVLLVIVVFHKKIKNKFYVIFGLSCIFIICSLDGLSSFALNGMDLGFHYNRIMGLAEGVMSGQLPVRIQPGWLNGYGYAVSIMYGDVLLYIPALLYLAGVPLIHTYMFYILLINFGSITIAYYCYKKTSGDSYIGVTCAALYCLSIGRLLNIYVRAAVGEYSAFMFLPFVVLGIWQIFSFKNTEAKKNKGWIYLSVGMTGVIQSHILSFLMVCVFIIFIAIICIKKIFCRQVFFSFFKSVMTVIFLNMGFWLPFLDYSQEELRVYADKWQYSIQHARLSFYELVAIDPLRYGYAFDIRNGMADRFPESLGISLIFIIICGIILFVKLDWSPYERKRLVIVSFLAFLAVFMMTIYFPWNKLAKIAIIKNIAASFQFPWRFVSIAIPLLVLLACILFMKLKLTIKFEHMRWLLVGGCILCAYQGMQCTELIVSNSASNTVYDGKYLFNDPYSVIEAEYLLEGTNVSLAIQDDSVICYNGDLQGVERESNQFWITCKAADNAYVEIPLFAYKYYRCTDVDTGKAYDIIQGENNKIRIDLSEGYQGTLGVRFVEPWYWRVAEGISLITFGAILCLSFASFVLYYWKNKELHRKAGIYE